MPSHSSFPPVKSLRDIMASRPDLTDVLAGARCRVSSHSGVLYEGRLTRSALAPYLADTADTSLVVEAETAPGVIGYAPVNPVGAALAGRFAFVRDVVESGGSFPHDKAIEMSLASDRFPALPGGGAAYEAVAGKYGGLVARIYGAVAGYRVDEGGGKKKKKGDDGTAALGQPTAKEKEMKEKAAIKFKIWIGRNELTTDLSLADKYLKIEYVYEDKKKGLLIDFLLGKNEAGQWGLFAGKLGSVSYDDEPVEVIPGDSFAEVLNDAVDMAYDYIQKVRKDPDGYVQFYLHR